MYKTITSEIRKYRLDSNLYDHHRTGYDESDFGLNNSKLLIDGGFGLYSTLGIKEKIGPIKSDYYRFALVRNGYADVDIGLEHYKVSHNYIITGFPGQIFSLHNHKNFFAYYLLFSEEFVADSILLRNRQLLPFFTYAGIQCLELTEETANEIEKIIFRINTEIKNRKPDSSTVIKLYIQLALIEANRSYGTIMLSGKNKQDSSETIFSRFLKMVSEHFLQFHKVSDYAEKLHISPDHLNRIIKLKSGKTAHELIDEMLLIEAKAYLLHTPLSVAEVAYKLDFADPSHFNKFFRKLSGITPLQYRNMSE